MGECISTSSLNDEVGDARAFVGAGAKNPAAQCTTGLRDPCRIQVHRIFRMCGRDACRPAARPSMLGRQGVVASANPLRPSSPHGPTTPKAICVEPYPLAGSPSARTCHRRDLTRSKTWEKCASFVITTGQASAQIFTSEPRDTDTR
jgi:hypothetical protein